MSFVSAAPSLTKDDVERFSRQVMVEGIGASGMARIRSGHVVCVGAGGLGSTIALYLVAAGVGKLTLIDFDRVEVSNLHRQVIHTTERVGQAKVESARQTCMKLFPGANVVAVETALTPGNAVSLFSDGDVVVDGTDNVAARYVINDAAMRCRKPLVSGSAMRWEGQLSVYGFAEDGPCYRCLYPVPPPAAAVGSCNDSGVVGPVPGMIGCLQAMEVLKILAGAGEVLSGRLLVFDGLRFDMRVVKLRGRQKDCKACSEAARANAEPLSALTNARPEYLPAACPVGAQYSRIHLPDNARCTAADFAKSMRAALADPAGPRCLCIDVRHTIQFDMAHLPWATSLPLPTLQRWESDGSLPDHWNAFVGKVLQSTDPSCPPADHTVQSLTKDVIVFFICRRGIASTEATMLLLPHASNQTFAGYRLRLQNVDGGLNAYHTDVDQTFPYY